MLFGAAAYEENRNSLIWGVLERGGYGEDSRKYELLVEGICQKPVPVTVEISPLQYGEEEAQTAFEELFSRLPEEILGENQSLDQVRTDLNLVTLFENTGIRAVWHSENPDIIDSYGRIFSEEIPARGREAALQVILTDGKHRKEGYITVTVLPLFSTIEEQVAADFTRQVYEADIKEPENRLVELPAEYEGKSLIYRKPRDSDYWIFPFLGAAAAVLLYGQEKAKEEQKRKERNQLLMIDYADMVYQLMVYTGAGLTIGKSWEYIVENYERWKKQNHRQKRPVYEEMAFTLGQIQCGVAEGKAVNEFGRRCKLQPYVKLSSLLDQNRKTGTKNLNQLLEQEMKAAWEEQKHIARRMGEEAKTKLLAPLFLMLVVVMVIIMVPAMMAVQ